MSCNSLCNGDIKASGATTNFFSGLGSAAGLHISPSNTNSSMTGIKSALEDLQVQFDSLSVAGFQAVSDVQKAQAKFLSQQAQILVNELDISLGGGIAINSELLIFYGIIILLLVMAEVFKSN